MPARARNPSRNRQRLYTQRGRYLEQPAWQTLIELAESILGGSALRDLHPPRTPILRWTYPRCRDYARIISGEDIFWFLWTQPNTPSNVRLGISQPDFMILKTTFVNNNYQHWRMADIEVKNVNSRLVIGYDWFEREIICRFANFLANSNILIASFFQLERGGEIAEIQRMMRGYQIDVIELGFQAGPRDRNRIRGALTPELRPRLERLFSLTPPLTDYFP